MTTAASVSTPTTPCITEGIPLEWRRRCISYSLESSGSKDFPLSEVRSIVRSSFDTWLAVGCAEGSPGFEVEETEQLSACDRAEYNGEDGNVNTIAFVTDWNDREYDPLAYALTTVWHNTRTGEIYDADMEINEARGTYGTCPEPDGCTDGTIDLENVVTHEAGHFFGMAHTDLSLTQATMHAISDPGEIAKRTLDADDAEGFCAAYPPGVLPAECSFTPRHGLALECGGDSGGCGCVVVGARRTGEGAGLLAVIVALGLVVLRRRRRG